MTLTGVDLDALHADDFVFDAPPAQQPEEGALPGPSDNLL
jgi:hypothetical protein